MRRNVAFVTVVSLVVFGLPIFCWAADESCTTVEQALGFANEKALQTFLDLAKVASKNPAKADHLQKILLRD